MAMLAEKREKKSIRSFMLKSKPLTSDSCKVGQRLLEKMGWTPGKGLGVKEDGSPDPLRIKFKCDIKGLGFKENEKDALSCQEGFNDLLASLSQHNNSYTSHKNDEEDKALNSLEMVSKKSRARVHYQKFTRGKDLSQASSKDLASILGLSTEKVPEVITNKVQTSPFPSSLVCEDDGSSKRKREECISSASAITEDADFNLGSESVIHKKKKKKKNLECEKHENFGNEKNTFDANSSPSGRRKSVTWGDVEVSYVSKYISDMIDTSSESFKEDDAASTMLPENVFDVKTPTDKQINKKKKKKKVNNTDEGDHAIVSNIDSNKLISSGTACAGSGNPTDDSVSSFRERKKQKKKKKIQTNLQDVPDSCSTKLDSSSEISLDKQIAEGHGTEPIVMKEIRMKKKKQKKDKYWDDSERAVETLDKCPVKSYSSEGMLINSEYLNGFVEKGKREKRNDEEINSSVINLLTEERASDFCQNSLKVMMTGNLNSDENNVTSTEIQRKDKKKLKTKRISEGLSIKVEESLKPSGKESFDDSMALEQKIENRKRKEKKRVREKESMITLTTKAERCSTVPVNRDGDISISDSQEFNSSCVSFPSNHKRKSKKRTADENVICNLHQTNDGGASGAGEESNDPVKDEEVSTLHVISNEVIKPHEDGESLAVTNNKPVLSFLTKERMTKWKKRHKSSQSTTLDGAPNVKNPASHIIASTSPSSAVQETSLALPSIDKRKSAKKYNTEQLNELNFEGSNLNSIKGYGFPVAV